MTADKPDFWTSPVGFACFLAAALTFTPATLILAAAIASAIQVLGSDAWWLLLVPIFVSISFGRAQRRWRRQLTDTERSAA